MRAALQEQLQTLDSVTVTMPGQARDSGAPAASLQIKVSLSPVLAHKLPKDATLFVFAKAASGPPMPLAVQRLPGARLPLELTLDDSMAMAPQLKLSQFDRYVITARLSKRGGSQPQRGDLQGSVEVDRSAAGVPVIVSIDTVVP
jgi:cytochrome c-type biogenesis protein CcmH